MDIIAADKVVFVFNARAFDGADALTDR